MNRMNFDAALEAARAGARIRRTCWAPDLWLQMMPGSPTESNPLGEPRLNYVYGGRRVSEWRGPSDDESAGKADWVAVNSDGSVIPYKLNPVPTETAAEPPDDGKANGKAMAEPSIDEEKARAMEARLLNFLFPYLDDWPLLVGLKVKEESFTKRDEPTKASGGTDALVLIDKLHDIAQTLSAMIEELKLAAIRNELKATDKPKEQTPPPPKCEFSDWGSATSDCTEESEKAKNAIARERMALNAWASPTGSLGESVLDKVIVASNSLNSGFRFVMSGQAPEPKLEPRAHEADDSSAIAPPLFGFHAKKPSVDEVLKENQALESRLSVYQDACIMWQSRAVRAEQAIESYKADPVAANRCFLQHLSAKLVGTANSSAMAQPSKSHGIPDCVGSCAHKESCVSPEQCRRAKRCIDKFDDLGAGKTGGAS